MAMLGVLFSIINNAEIEFEQTELVSDVM